MEYRIIQFDRHQKEQQQQQQNKKDLESKRNATFGPACTSFLAKTIRHWASHELFFFFSFWSGEESNLYFFFFCSLVKTLKNRILLKMVQRLAIYLSMYRYLYIRKPTTSFPLFIPIYLRQKTAKTIRIVKRSYYL